MTRKILIMGLPGSGKTTLAKSLKQKLDHCYHLNADEVRQKYDDWDFSEDGRIRQSERMSNLADSYLKTHKYCICDFVCPTLDTVKIFNADYLIYMNTIREGRFDDTNKMFQRPNFNFGVKVKDAETYSFLIKQDIIT